MLDRWLALSYIGACALLAGCPGRLPPLIPLPLAPGNRDSALAWAAATAPGQRRAVRFRWRYEDAAKRWAGRGQARIAPPDSLRFDYTGALGIGVGAAVVVGDSAIWADPEKNFRSLVPAVRLLWAGLGIARPPAADAAVFAARGSGPDSAARLWRFVQGDDTLEYRDGASNPRLLEAEWRRAGKILARSRTEFDVHGMPGSARIDFPEDRARFELTVVGVDTAATFDPSIWRARR